MKNPNLLLFWAVLVAALIAPEGMACKCAPGVSLKAQIDASAAVVEATATAVTRNSTLGVNSPANFTVSKVWKGEVPPTLHIEWNSTCDYDSFTQGVAYLLILSRATDGSWEASKCSRTKPLEIAAEERAYLQRIRKPHQRPQQSAKTSDPCSNHGPVRVGGIITAPNPVSRDDSQIRRLAAAEGKHGFIILETVIDKAGRIQDARTLQAPPAVRVLAVDVVRTWRFRPALCNGKAIAVIYNVTVEY